MSSSLIQLECGCNNYPWGKKGKDSLAAKYAASTPGGSFKLDESKEYAEVCSSMPVSCFSFISLVTMAAFHCFEFTALLAMSNSSYKRKHKTP
jgi:hypothetical protein